MKPAKDIECLDPVAFRFYEAPAGRCVEVGPQRASVPLPPVPLPVHPQAMEKGEPSDDAIGQGTYDYLRQFPDCPFNTEYARLLADAYSHFISDLASQIVMLDYKEVDAPYIRRQITYMKILLLLDPENAGLLHQLGKASLEVGLNFSQLANVRYDLLKALGYFQRALKHRGNDPSTLNFLGQIDYWLGDYPGCLRHWQGVVEALPQGPVRDAIDGKILRVEAGETPDHALVDDLEAIGQALVLYGERDIRGALELLEQFADDAEVLKEFGMPEFHALVGMCREKLGDPGGAFAAYDKALEIDPQFEDALQGKDRISGGERR